MIHVAADTRGAALAAAGALLDLLERALAESGRVRVAISGGRTPEPMLARLAARGGGIDWSAVHIYFVDERAVPPGDPESNYGMAVRALVPPGGAPRFHRMPADAPDLMKAAADYAAALETPLDAVVLGMGADGHTASLFPGSPLAADAEGRVGIVNDSPKPPRTRMTILPRTIREARARMMLVTGADKAAAVARALEGDPDPLACPAQLARDGAWFMDRAAAAGLRFAAIEEMPFEEG